MRRTCRFALLLLPLLAWPAAAATTTLEIAVAAGKSDRSGTPISATVTLPAVFHDAKVVTLKDANDKPLAVAQLTGPALLNEGPEKPESEKIEVRRELHFILPTLK